MGALTRLLFCTIMKLAVMFVGAVLLAAIVASAPVPESDSPEQVVPEMRMETQRGVGKPKWSPAIDKDADAAVESKAKTNDKGGVSKTTEDKNAKFAASENTKEVSEQKEEAKREEAQAKTEAEAKAKEKKEEDFMVNMLMCQSQGDDKDCSKYCTSKELGSDSDTVKKKKKTCMKYFKKHKRKLKKRKPRSAKEQHAINVARKVLKESIQYLKKLSRRGRAGKGKRR